MVEGLCPVAQPLLAALRLHEACTWPRKLAPHRRSASAANGLLLARLRMVLIVMCCTCVLEAEARVRGQDREGRDGGSLCPEDATISEADARELGHAGLERLQLPCSRPIRHLCHMQHDVGKGNLKRKPRPRAGAACNARPSARARI